jgi:mRNA interferase YafQ
MYTIRTTNQFKKDLKRCKKKGLNINILEEAIQLLAESGTLPLKYKSHKLSGTYQIAGNVT